MSKYRQAAKIDANQTNIVKLLRYIYGCKVELGHDDILVGYKGKNYWYEIKTPDCVSKKTGAVRESAKKNKQSKLEQEWTGHYKIVSSFEEILKDLGLIN